MQKRITFIISLLFSSCSLFAQFPQRPYEPLIFENLDYLWYDVSKDEGVFSFRGDGYNCFKPAYELAPNALLYDGYIYSVAYRRHSVALYDGTYIEKRNAKTGELEWRRFFGYRGSDTKVEYARLMYINDDNQLELISQQTPSHIDDIPFNVFYRDGLLLTKRVYDLQTGQLIENVQPDPNVDDYFKTDLYFGREITKFYREKNGIRVFFKKQREDVNYWAFYYITAVVNPLDKHVVFDTLRSEFFDSDFAYFKMKEDLFIISEHIDSTQQFVFKYVDGRMNVLSVIISELQESWNFLSGLDFLEYDEDSETFLAKVIDFDFAKGTLSEDVVIIDTRGNVKKKIRVPDVYDYRVNVLEWKGGKIKVLAGKSPNFNDSSYSFDLLEESVVHVGTFDVAYSYKTKDKLRGAGFYDVVQTENALIIPLWERNFYYNTNTRRYSLDEFGDAVSMLAISKDKFGLSSTSHDMAKVTFDVFPNPFDDRFYFSFDRNVTGIIQVRNATGVLMTEHHITSQSDIYTDGKSWASGMYFVSFINQDRKVITKKVVKM